MLISKIICKIFNPRMQQLIHSLRDMLFKLSTLFKLYEGILFLNHETVITALSFIVLLVLCFSSVKSKKYRFAESCSIPLAALIMFKYLVLFYLAMSLLSEGGQAFSFEKIGVWPRLTCLFLDLISECGFFSIFYKHDTKLEYDGLQILNFIVFCYMVLLEFCILETDDRVLYQSLDSGVFSRILIYSKCLLLIYIIYILLMRWKKNGLKSK